jgi:uncharacterized protein YkwD
MKKLLFYCLLILGVPFFVGGKKLQKGGNVQVTSEELKLYNLIIAYRAQNGLHSIALSTSLTEVAHLHARDLEINHPDSAGCNMHSWSAKGKWQSCCYTPDHAQKLCMWNKPRELTAYTGNGFEIAAKKYDLLGAELLALWKASKPHNDVILNKGVYNRKWNAIGIGIYKDYSVIWFGHEVDNRGAPAKP